MATNKRTKSPTGVHRWSIAWKGMALWKSAHKDQKWWFIAFLVINTAGILEILYIYVFSADRRISAKTA